MIRRAILATRMTLAYRGRVPRHRMWRVYWRAVGYDWRPPEEC